MDRPTNLMMINGVLGIDGTPDPARLREVVEQRILVLPRFRQRIVRRGWRPFWEDDPEFDLGNHLHWMKLSAPGGDAELGELVSGLVSEPLDPQRPLWRFHVIEGHLGGTVLYARVHHCIGDGVGLMFVLLSLVDLVADPHAGDLQNPFTSMLRESSPALLEEACQVAEQVMPEGMRLLMASAEAFRSTSGWLKALASVAAMGRYLEKRGDRRHARLNFRAAMPVNLRAIDKMADMGNEFGLVFLSLPVGIRDPVERLQVLRKRAYALRKSGEPLVVYWLLKMMGILPRWFHSLIVAIFGSKATAVMTNMPGPKQQLYLAGRPIHDIFFWVPQSGTVGLGFAICSYNGRIRVGVGTDAGLVPDPERIVEEFHAEIDEMRRRAGG